MTYKKRKIGVITTSRADYGIYTPILDKLNSDPEIDFGLFVSGTHLSEEHGFTISRIEEDGFPIWDKIEIIQKSDDTASISKAIGVTTQKFGESYARNKPDIILSLGDRYEMLGAVLATVPFNIPVAHIHGGEVSEGAIDDVFRHAITKISHIHFPATELSARRIRQMGENLEFIFPFGAPSLDNLNSINLLSKVEMADRHGIDKDKDYLLVTYHPVTKEINDAENQIINLLEALDSSGFNLVFTLANADTGGKIINNKVIKYVEDNKDKAIIADNIGTQSYFSAINNARAVIGNSSSGIIEAASFKTAVVNIGNRQKGREQSQNIIDSSNQISDIRKAIKKACSNHFNQEIHDVENVYGDSNASENIVNILKTCNIDNAINKQFHLID